MAAQSRLSVPYFRVGETVRVNQKHLTGEHVIVSTELRTIYYSDIRSEITSWAYKLSGYSRLVWENDLEKVHQPADTTFKALLRGLKKARAAS